MQELNKSINNVVELLKSKSTKEADENINELYNLFLTFASIVGAIKTGTIITPFANGATLSAIKPASIVKFIKGKLGLNDKKFSSIKERYENLSMVNLIIVHISARGALEEALKDNRDFLGVQRESFEYLQKKLNEISKKIETKYDKKLKDSSISLGITTSFNEYINLLFKPFYEIVNAFYVKDSKEIIDKKEKINRLLIEKTIFNYKALIINLIEDFPEFGVFIDLSQKSELSNINREIYNKLEEIEEKLYKNEFNNEKIGLKTFNEYKNIIQHQTNTIIEAIKKEKTDDINSYLKNLKLFATKSVIEIEEDEKRDESDFFCDINEDIYIPQSYKIINYSDRYDKKFLIEEFWDGTKEEDKERYKKEDREIFEAVVTKEDIQEELNRSLLNPNNTFKPIIILGHPGAGKSMLSHLLAVRLAESNDYFPFLVRLRDINSSISNIDSHINESIKLTIRKTEGEINWISWAREYKDRVIVIILDGFDELLRLKEGELNSYLLNIEKLQRDIFNSEGIVVKFIVTSRLAVMQDVSIPTGSQIIKLNSFDENRQKVWIDNWNIKQNEKTNKDINFFIPENRYIKELAKEPLLLFMLAIYDFEDNGSLAKDAQNDNFNRSKLYDKLLDKLTKRQLKKDSSYNKLGNSEQIIEEDIFRLRLGLIALMMFLNNRIHHNSDELQHEIEAFKLQSTKTDTNKTLDPSYIFKGFFFMHKNTSTNAQKEQKISFEFLHKTFAEFLTADFLIKLALHRSVGKYKGRLAEDEELFNFAFGYSWLYRHPKIISFLIEHLNNMKSSEEDDNTVLNEKIKKIKSLGLEKEEENNLIDTLKSKNNNDNELSKIEELIKKELKTIFSDSQMPFPLPKIKLNSPKPLATLKHLAIYSQNLIFLWLALNKRVEFKIQNDDFENSKKKISGFETYEDIEESFINKAIWKEMNGIWKSFGNSQASAKLSEWVNVVEESEVITLTLKNKYKEIYNYYFEASKNSCNDFELLLSYNYTDFKVEDIKRVLEKKPILLKTALDVLFNRFDYILYRERKALQELLLNENLIDKDTLLSHPILVKLFINLEIRGINREEIENSVIDIAKDNFSSDIIYKGFYISKEKKEVIFENMINNPNLINNLSLRDMFEFIENFSIFSKETLELFGNLIDITLSKIKSENDKAHLIKLIDEKNFLNRKREFILKIYENIKIEKLRIYSLGYLTEIMFSYLRRNEELYIGFLNNLYNNLINEKHIIYLSSYRLILKHIINEIKVYKFNEIFKDIINFFIKKLIKNKHNRLDDLNEVLSEHIYFFIYIDDSLKEKIFHFLYEEYRNKNNINNNFLYIIEIHHLYNEDSDKKREAILNIYDKYSKYLMTLMIGQDKIEIIKILSYYLPNNSIHDLIESLFNKIKRETHLIYRDLDKLLNIAKEVLKDTKNKSKIIEEMEKVKRDSFNNIQ